MWLKYPFLLSNFLYYPLLTADGRIITAVEHSSSQNTVVDGYQEPGSFRQDIIYDANRQQLEALLNRSDTCMQHLEYMCRHSRLLNSPSK